MMRITEDNKLRLYELEDTIGYKFQDIRHLYRALMHKSYLNENIVLDTEDNERYEFFGDAVLQFAATKYLFDKYPDRNEGILTTMRSALVDRANCARLARHYRLVDYIFLGRGERGQEKGIKRSILANAFEALVAGIFFDGGIDACINFVINAFQTVTPDIERMSSQNFKAQLQSYVQRRYQKVPVYRVLSAEGPDHDKTFEVSVLVNGEVYGTGTGQNKKTAQQEAAREALNKISGTF